MAEKVVKSEAEWREQLTPEQYEVCRHKGTERAFTGKYHAEKREGVYRCACCGNELFDAQAKYESGTGWPSFFAPIAPDRVQTVTDGSHGMARTEVLCARCDAHLGHVFPDGPRPTGERYCMNSIALDLAPREE
jgi:peptide-methionine (R)-S-oxide reductase